MTQDEAERQADEQAEKLARARRASARAAQALGLPPPGTPPLAGGAAPLAKEATLAEMREVGCWAGCVGQGKGLGIECCRSCGWGAAPLAKEATVAEMREVGCWAGCVGQAKGLGIERICQALVLKPSQASALWVGV